MTNFSSNWIKDKKVNTPDRIKGAVRTPQPLKPKIELAKNKIQIQNHKLDTILDKLKGKEKSLFNQVVAHMQIHDMQQGKMLSNELAQVRKTTKMISQLKMALEQIHMRLESTIDIGDVMVAIGPAMGALTRVKSGLSGVMPEVDTELGEINGVFSDIITNAGNMGNASLTLDANGEDVDKILAEASAVAEQRMNDNFPDIPLGSFNSDSRSAVDEHSQ
jgi:division protein CdvB (Snf7/Vps24/ESCRT-III family)